MDVMSVSAKTDQKTENQIKVGPIDSAGILWNFTIVNTVLSADLYYSACKLWYSAILFTNSSFFYYSQAYERKYFLLFRSLLM